MTETETKNPDKTLKVASTKTLTLKRGIEQGMVRQSFSHGRSKAVVVEKVKRRVGPGDVIVIPGNLPHWWSSLDSDIRYLIYRPDPEGLQSVK